eukprot:TRINITY_DN46695_c0_g1_i1.p1 TRINITY_DN46695_c0_g1~~TRINITY_DN46695_c0_g1_i1.p1  ORF type:complete len:301 (-),score=60.91 TRINITY_DN46695_c0_g1_i1:503-1405(-)
MLPHRKPAPAMGIEAAASGRCARTANPFQEPLADTFLAIEAWCDAAKSPRVMDRRDRGRALLEEDRIAKARVVPSAAPLVQMSERAPESQRRRREPSAGWQLAGTAALHVRLQAELGALQHKVVKLADRVEVVNNFAHVLDRRLVEVSSLCKKLLRQPPAEPRSEQQVSNATALSELADRFAALEGRLRQVETILQSSTSSGPFGKAACSDCPGQAAGGGQRAAEEAEAEQWRCAALLGEHSVRLDAYRSALESFGRRLASLEERNFRSCREGSESARRRLACTSERDTVSALTATSADT